MAAPPLTRRQRDIVDFFRAYTAEHGLSPTLDEIAHAFGVHKVTVFGHVAELERKGVLERSAPGVSRGLRLVGDAEAHPALRVPLLGRIAAGSPIEAIEVPEELDLQDLVPAGRDVYALRVSGDSMIEDAIRDGDIVLVERRTHASDGETVVAVVDGDVTLKRFYREPGGIRLQPANSSLSPLHLEADADLAIRGIVVGVVRQY